MIQNVVHTAEIITGNPPIIRHPALVIPCTVPTQYREMLQREYPSYIRAWHRMESGTYTADDYGRVAGYCIKCAKIANGCYKVRERHTIAEWNKLGNKRLEQAAVK